MAAITITGTLTRCERRREDAIDWNHSHQYSPRTAHYVVYLDCELTTSEGVVYFRTPSTEMDVTNAGSAAIVTFNDTEYDEQLKEWVWPANHPWFHQVGTRAVATVDQPNDVRLEPKIHVGDTITIRGRVKREATSKRGNGYRVLSHVKRFS
jgi:hypothetical protein